MKPVKTEASNFTYRGPTPDIMDLPCELVAGERGGKDTYSVWSLTKDEREIIAAGGNIRLGIVGMHPIPPVSLEVVERETTWKEDAERAYEAGRTAGRRGYGSLDNPHLNAFGEIPEGMDSLAEQWDQGWELGDREAEDAMPAPVEDFPQEEYGSREKAVERSLLPLLDRLWGEYQTTGEIHPNTQSMVVNEIASRKARAEVEDFPQEEYAG